MGVSESDRLSFGDTPTVMRRHLPFSWGGGGVHSCALVKARGDRLCDSSNPNPGKDWGFHGRGISLTHDSRDDLSNGIRIGDE
jgi:hypothetical protein